MTRRELLEAATIPAWLCIFMFLGACLGMFAWALSWVVEAVKAL